jgi:UDP-glucuronate 4-epimerase
VTRILVTGAAGFVGSHLSEALVEAGHDVVGVDAFVGWYPRQRKHLNLASLQRSPAFSFHEVDLRSDDLAPCMTGVEAVINVAAVAGLVHSWTEMKTYADCNLLAVHRLLEACTVSRVRRFVQISTSSVYGRNALGDELQSTEPVSPYGVTKLAAEHLVRSYAEAFGHSSVILRYFSVYGPRQRPDMAYHIFIESMRRSRPIEVYGDGKQSRSNTYIDDCVRATILALERGRAGEVYNVGGGSRISLLQAIDLLAGALGVEPTIDFREPRPGDQRHTDGSIEKAKRDLGYAPATEPAEGLRRQVAWHLANLPLQPKHTQPR